MKALRKSGIWLIAGIVAAGACTKIQTYPPEPEIAYKSFSIYDTVLLGNTIKIGILQFSFIDGDGDIGWKDTLSTPPANPEGYNLFVTMYEMINGTFFKVDDERVSDPIKYRIPYIENDGPDKSLKGDIYVEFQYFFHDFDTIRYEFYIIDRALHESNLATTPEIILKY
jgi:hypothetical protein